ncbi:MAG TPA: T9SS type A sorting domain-containing protein, partial [Ignavibacteriales bacterium]|nr:T9SS type A sorting domain-containing protein [Ignavibacteriales bacterium]
PFNPSTTIKYSIQAPGLVKIKVFNILGAEVATLVNEIQTAGNHQVSFNASRLSSGVYFYSIESGSFRNVKKMVFLK